MVYYKEGGVAVKRGIKRILCLCLSALLLAGCSVQTVDQMYQLPKRSEDYSNLQSVMDEAMAGLSFCAPVAGDNQQSVQMADIDGDKEQEYLVFAKGNAEQPLRILVFDRVDNVFVHTDTVKSNGAAFDQVEYIQMDDTPGLEMVVGRQVSDQLARSVSVYTFAGGTGEQILSANYRKYVTVDLDSDGYTELFVLRSGQTEADNGIAELYSIRDGVMERSNEATLSQPADRLKRILVGKLHDKRTAVYVASTVEDSSLITDVYTQLDDHLTNVSLSQSSGSSDQTFRNYYVYADDMDDDGVVELPQLRTMVPMGDENAAGRSDLICWYAMASNGQTHNKLYTYYDSVGGWYLEIDSDLIPRITVQCTANAFHFYLWNEGYTETEALFTIYILTGQNHEEQSGEEERIVLMGTDTVTYAASLSPAAANYGITQQTLLRSFSLIHRDWNSGEM